jgi:hypothetical protein
MTASGFQGSADNMAKNYITERRVTMEKGAEAGYAGAE